jgi:SAM-dependent methyltransferase
MYGAGPMAMATGGSNMSGSTTAVPQQTRSILDGSTRPRLLSYVGRWGRARRWLPMAACRVLDVGCAFGYGTAALKGRGDAPPWVVGIERDEGHIRHAGMSYPWLPLLRGDARNLPFGDASVDAVVMLDIVEHIGDPTAVLAEARRVLRPGGCLVVSVPYKGPMTHLDPNNLYEALRRRWPSCPPLDEYDESESGTHRHFSIDELREVLGPNFAVDRVARTGIGLSEVLQLIFRVTLVALLRWRKVYMMLLPLHFIMYLLDDLIPAGPLGYHLTLRARAI